MTVTFEIPITVDIPDGTYVASLAGVTEDSGSFGKFRRWTWLVEVPKTDDKEGSIEELTQLTSANTGPQSKSYRQLTALLGEAPKAGQKIDSPNGKRVTVTITHNDKGFPTIGEVGPYVDPQMALPGIPR
jgi:hypothetical protein